MASIKGRFLKATLKTISPIINSMSIEVQRSRQDFLGALKKTPPGVVSIPADLGQIRAEWFCREGACEAPVILHFHGGAYVTGSLASNRVIASELAFETGCRVLTFEYRLAPEHPYPAALNDAVDVYEHLICGGLKPEEIHFAGESAGGGLLLCTALALKAQNKPMPASCICLSPWTDLACTGGTLAENARKDPLLTEEYLVASAAMYAGQADKTSPYLSPLYGDFSGLPRVLLHAGEDEILLDDSKRIWERMCAKGVDATLKIWPEMWHVWHIFDIPEAHEALQDIGEFIKTRNKT